MLETVCPLSPVEGGQLARNVVRAERLLVGQSGLVDVGHAGAAALAQAHLRDGVKIEAVAADVELAGAPVEHVILAAGQVVLRLGADGLVHLVPVLLPVEQSLGVDSRGAQYESPERLDPGDPPGEVLVLSPLLRLVTGDRVLEPLAALHGPELVNSSAHPPAPGAEAQT